MHELGITQEIVKQVLEAANQHQAKTVKQVKLKIGDFTNIEPESVKFYFEILTPGTIAEKARLVIEKIPLKMVCKDCKKKFAPPANPPIFLCPKCESGKLEILTGRELEISDIEIED